MTRQATLIIYSSPNGRDNWQPVKPEDVPQWLKDPERMAHLVAGEMACKNDEGDRGSDWYKAVRVLPQAEVETIRRAQAKRVRRAAKRATVH